MFSTGLFSTERKGFEMAISLKVALFLGILIYFFLILILLRKRSLSLKYTLLWILTGLVMTVVLLWPNPLYLLAAVIGIELPSNALFALLFLFIMLILMSLTAIASGQAEDRRRLTQYVALLEKRVRELEHQTRDVVSAGQ